MQRLPDLPKTPFDTMKNLVKEKNEVMLNQLEAQGFLLSEFKGPFNLVMLLAREGDFDSIDFLLKKFQVNINHVLFGAGWGCQIKYVKKILNSGNIMSINYLAKGIAICGNIKVLEELIDEGASLNTAVEGAAFGGHVELVYSLLKRGANINFAVRGAACASQTRLMDDLLIRGGSLTYAAEGAARGEHHELTLKLIDISSTVANLNIMTIERTMMGAAHSGNIDFISQLFRIFGFHYSALFGAASGGHHFLFTILLELVPSENQKIQLLTKSIEYAAAEYHYDFVVKVLTGLNNNGKGSAFIAACKAVRGAAFGGNMKLVTELTSYYKISLDYAVYGAAQGFELKMLNVYLRKGSVNLDKVVNIMSGYLTLPDSLRLISFVDNENLRVKLSQNLKWKPTINILASAENINFLMRRYYLTFNQAKVYLKLQANPSASWLLMQGHKYMSNHGLSFEVYLYLLMQMIEPLDKVISTQDIASVYSVAHKRLRDQMIEEKTTGFFALFKSKDEIEKYKQNIIERYNERLLY